MALLGGWPGNKWSTIGMPIYEYLCQACGYELEIIQKISDELLTVCPECEKSTLKKKVSAAAFRLSGGGWYETDFKTGDKKNLAAGDKRDSADGGKSSGSGSGGNDSAGSTSGGQDSGSKGGSGKDGASKKGDSQSSNKSGSGSTGSGSTSKSGAV